MSFVDDLPVRAVLQGAAVRFGALPGLLSRLSPTTVARRNAQQSLLAMSVAAADRRAAAQALAAAGREEADREAAARAGVRASGGPG